MDEHHSSIIASSTTDTHLSACPSSYDPSHSIEGENRCGRPVHGHSVIGCTFAGCTKEFKRPSRLQQHMRSHTGEVRLKPRQDTMHAELL